MFKHLKSAALVSLASAALVAGCDQRSDRGAIDDAKPKSPDARPIALNGCVGTGPGTQQLFLTQVQVAPLAGQPSDAPTSVASSITEHSQVKLAMAAGRDDELSTLVGKRVTVTGTLRDDGRNTIGTAGTERSPNEPERRADASQAGTPQSHSEKVREEAGPIGNRSINNGTFPEVLVQKVDNSGQACTPTPVEERR
jgi:hypothetical protein